MSIQVGLTRSVEPPDGVVDAPGEIIGIDFHPQEPLSHRRLACSHGVDSVAGEHAATSVVVLRRHPQCVYVKLADCQTEFLPPSACSLHSVVGADRACKDCNFYTGVLAVRPFTSRQPWSIHISCATEDEDREVKVRRTQLPMVTVKASTLHVLQGTTADPGLIFHWVFPRRLRRDMRWLVIYVALSRVRRLKNLRSIGLNKDIREIMEAGPPDTLPAQFSKLFDEKEKQTNLDADAAMKALGWLDWLAVSRCFRAWLALRETSEPAVLS